MRDWRRFVRQRFHGAANALDDRVVDEIADHLELIHSEALDQGASEAEAERSVLRALGEGGDELLGLHELQELQRAQPAATRLRADRWVEGVVERGHERGGIWSRAADVLRELRVAVRTLAKQPLFSATVVIVLGVGIGATSAIFTLVDSIVLSPLPFDGQHRLVSIHHHAPTRGFDDAGQCAAWHATYEDSSGSLEYIGMFGAETATVMLGETPEARPVLRATHGVFSALRLDPLLGRTMTADDSERTAEPVVWVTESFWRTHFGGERSAVGRPLRIGGRDHELAGVIPDTIQGLGIRADVVVPLLIDRSEIYVGNIGFGAVARLAAGASVATAEAELQSLLPTAWERFPGGPIATDADIEAFTVTVEPLKARILGPTTELLWLLLMGVGLVLVVACSNVANLLLVRVAEQREAFAVRAALGASWLRIRWDAAREIAVLCLFGGAFGLVLSRVGVDVLVRMAPQGIPRLSEIELGPRVILLTFGISMLVGLLIALVPRPAGALAVLGRGAGRGSRGPGRRLRVVVATGQLAVMLALLIGSGLMFRSLQALRDVDPGVADADSVLTFRVDIPPAESAETEEFARLFVAIARELESIPGVEAVAMATAIPMDGRNNVNGLYAPGRRDRAPQEPSVERHKWVGGGYFGSLAVPVLRGREITWDDVERRRPVAVVSESLALELWGSLEAALGQEVAARPEPWVWSEVVGVVADVRDDGLSELGLPMVYWPQVTPGFWRGTAEDSPMAWRSNGFAVRSERVGGVGLVDDVHRAVWRVNPALALAQVTPLSTLADESMAAWTFAYRLLGAAAVLALFLGGIGVYGTFSQTVSQQMRELGIRAALGASAGRVRAVVFRRAAGVCIVGLILGVLLGTGFGRVMSGFLFGVQASDPLTIVVAGAVLILVVFGAVLPPARRAGAVDPLSMLREP